MGRGDITERKRAELYQTLLDRERELHQLARNHVDHVLAKLELSDRTQAAVWASQCGRVG